jgi:methionine biosynthesis protein MetW
MDPESLLSAVSKGVPVMKMDIDKELDAFTDNSYDVVILSRTLQAVHRPASVLTHMLRIAPTAIVSMPNFGYWRNRLRLLSGRAPISKDLPYAWHDSPNIHFGSCKDLESLFAELGFTIAECVPLSATGRVSHLPTVTRNFSAGATVYRLTHRTP